MSALLEQIIQEGEAAYPELGSERARILEQLKRQLTGSGRHRADLFLAAACAAGVPAAMERIEREILPRVRRPIDRVLPSGDQAEDLLQKLRRKLFSAGSKLSHYRGQGPLVGWTRAVALRLALELSRSAGARPDESLPEQLPAAEQDVELEYLYRENRAHFKAALRLAFARLGVRERAVLRMHLLEGIQVDRIAALYGVHRATVSRWLVQGREHVLEGVREDLAQRLRIDSAELNSLLRAVGTQMSVSLKELT